MPTPTSTDRSGNMESSNERNPRDDSKDPPVNVDDDIEPASEVKVYTNEDEEEEGLPETENSLSRRDKSIEDVKSGLINESEQCKDARTGDQLAFASKSFYFWTHQFDNFFLINFKFCKLNETESLFRRDKSNEDIKSGFINLTNF